MDRRTVVKNLALIIGGAVLLPSCLHKDGTASVQLKHIALNADDQSLIADICETIIPKTTTPGAKELNLPQFVLKMLDDCYNKKSQLTFAIGLADFKTAVTKKYQKDFTGLDIKEKEAFLTGIENSGKPKKLDKPLNEADMPPLNAFYNTIKQQTIFGYTTSQFFMTKEIVYELIPGRYNAHFPVKNLKTA